MIKDSVIKQNTVFSNLDSPMILIDNIVLYLLNLGYSKYQTANIIEKFDFPHMTYARKNGEFSKLCDWFYEVGIKIHNI